MRTMIERPSCFYHVRKMLLHERNEFDEFWNSVKQQGRLVVFIALFGRKPNRGRTNENIPLECLMGRSSHNHGNGTVKDTGHYTRITLPATRLPLTSKSHTSHQMFVADVRVRMNERSVGLEYKREEGKEHC